MSRDFECRFKKRCIPKLGPALRATLSICLPLFATVLRSPICAHATGYILPFNAECAKAGLEAAKEGREVSIFAFLGEDLCDLCV